MKKKIITLTLVLAVVVSSILLSVDILLAGNQNLLPGTTITANAEYYNGWYEYNRPISSLTDGNTYVGVGYNLGTTMVTPYNSKGEAYVNFAFNGATTLNKLVFYFPGTSAVAEADQVRDYAVDVQLENGAWKRVAEQHYAETSSNWDAYSDTVCFEAVTCTQLRVVSVNAKGQASAGFYEIEAYHDSSIKESDYTAIEKNNVIIPQTGYVNLLAGTTITANGSYYNGWYEYERPISALTDGNTYVGVGYNLGNTMITPYDGDGRAYVDFVFPKETTINKMVFYFPGTSAVEATHQVRDYAIDAKLADGSWVRVAEQHYAEAKSNWDAYSDTICFADIACTQLRVTSVNAKGQASAGYYEIEAYHDGNVEEKDYTALEKDVVSIPQVDYKNLLPGTTVTANRSYHEKDGGWYAANRPIAALTDGNTYVGVGYNLGNTMIAPYESDGRSYVEFEFAQETTFNKMVLYFPGTSAVETTHQVRDYAIDVCSADGVWTRVAKQHNEVVDKWDAYSDILCFKEITGTKLRITSVNAKGQASAGYYEIEAYHDEFMVEEAYTPLEEGDTKVPQPKSTQWVAEKELDDYAYSFAIVGDTQIVAKNDATYGTKDLKNLYKYILNKKKDYNIQQVIGVGDIIDTYDNEELMNKEWDVAAEAITQLDGKIPYILSSGNHDLNWRFNYVVPGRFPNYLTQSQVISRYGRIDAGEDTDEPSVANSAHAFSVGDKDYLVVTLEYAAHHTSGLMEWANGVVEAHPNHNVIINTHAYLAADGSVLDGTQEGSPSSYTGCEEHNDGDYFWDNLVKKHENIVMVLCGHVGVDNVVVSEREGEHGNKVTQIMTNAQDLDAEFGNMGMVTFLYFSEDGSTVQVRQYSTVHDRYYGKTSQLSGEDALEIDVIERSGTNCLKKKDKVIANDAYYNGWYPDFRPLSSLTDGDKDFIFRGDKATAIPYGSNGTAYVQFEFGKVRKFNQVKLYFPDAGADNNSMPMEDRITDFAIDVKLADGTWKRIAEQHVKAPTSWEKYNYVISFETVNCVAMRITSANHNSQKTLVFSEIEAFYHGDMSKEDYGMKTVVGNVVKEKTKVVNDCQDKTKLQIEKPMKNLLSGIIPTTNRADNIWYNEFRPLKNITDDVTDVYSAAKIATIDYCGGQAYFDFKFKKETKVNRVDIYVADSQNNEIKERATDFAVDVQLADGSWKRVAEVHVETPKQEEFYMYKITFEKVACKKIRVTSINQKGQTYFAISEIQAFLDETVMKPYTGITVPSSEKYEIPMPKIRLKSEAKFGGLSTSPEGKKVK